MCHKENMEDGFIELGMANELGRQKVYKFNSKERKGRSYGRLMDAVIVDDIAINIKGRPMCVPLNEHNKDTKGRPCYYLTKNVINKRLVKETVKREQVRKAERAWKASNW